MQHSWIQRREEKWPELCFFYWTGVVWATLSWSHLTATLSLTDIYAEVLLAPCWWISCLGRKARYSRQIPLLEQSGKLFTFLMSFSDKMKTFDLVLRQNDKIKQLLNLHFTFLEEGSIQMKTCVSGMGKMAFLLSLLFLLERIDTQ